MIQAFKGGYDNNLTYLITERGKDSQVLIDASVPLASIEESIGRDLRMLLITHSHGDHTAYIEEIIRRYPDAEIHGFSNFRKDVRCLRDGQILNLGGLEIEVIHTPGHYPDSVCFLIGNCLFTGDTLFVGRTGRTVGVGSDTGQLYRSVYSRLLTQPADTQLYPGHDYGPVPSITLAENIKISPLLNAANEADFCRIMKEFEAERSY